MALTEIVINETAKRLVGILFTSSSETVPEKLNELKRSFQQPAQQYVQTYLKRHGNIQILGMSRPISLDEIYTRVFMLDPEIIRGFETVEGLEQIYREAKQRGFNHHNSKTESGMDVANAEQYLCVLGGPGIGKTTYLRKIGLEALLSGEGQYQHKLIPVFLELKNFTNPGLNLKDEITHEFDICGFPDAPESTEKALNEGNLLILLDGLDEVPSKNVNRVINAIKDLSDRYAKNRFMVSCRIAAYYSYLKGLRNVAIAEFTKEQMSQFISNWFLADPNPSLTTEQKIQNGSDCWQQLQDSASIPTEELSQTPLLLTFICLAYRNSQTITDNRAALYAEALDILLKGWYKEKSLEESWEIYQYLPPRLEKELLAEIAYKGFEEDKLFFKKGDLAQQISTFLADTPKATRHLDSDAVIDAIAVEQGILVERAKDVYSFSHLTLQEFLCADYIIQWNYQGSLVKNHALDARWREVFFLATGLMGRAAISLVEKLEEEMHLLAEKNPYLKGLLVWACEKTLYSVDEYSGETKRIYGMILVFSLTLIYKLTYNLDLALTLASLTAKHATNTNDRTRIPTLANTLTHNLANNLTRNLDLILTLANHLAQILSNKLTHDLALARWFNSDLDLARDLSHDLDLARTRAHDLASVSAFANVSASAKINASALTLALGNARNLAFDLATTSANFIHNHGFISGVDLQQLIFHLKYASDNSHNSPEEIKKQISALIDISPELLVSTGEEIAITNYLLTCQLMLDCSKQASGLSAQQWEAIKQRMFLPKPAE